MFSFLSKKVLIFAGIGIVVITAIIFSLNKGNGKQTAVVVRSDIIQEVSATGKVKPSQSVNLGFDGSGRVGAVYASVGDAVRKGQIIASLESGEVSANLAKAEASLQEENIKLREIRNTAPISYGDASKNLSAAIGEGFADADDAVRNKADQFFKNNSANPQFEVSITSGNFIHYFEVPTDLVMSINNGRREVETILINWQKRIPGLSSSNLVSEADKAISDLNVISSFLDKMAGAVNSFSSADYAYDTTVSSYKTAVSGARTEVSGAVSAIVTAKDKFNLVSTLGESGQFSDVLTQEAKVKQAEASVSSLRASLGKSAITAPFDGVITLQDAKVGGAVSAGTALVSMISGNSMYIEANISEIHIGKVNTANKVLITFDAFPGEQFEGFVSYVEPGDVVVDGVVNYKIRVELGEVLAGENNQQIMKFANADQKIKSGLTANLKIQTDKKENVLALPLYAITNENGQNFVNKVVGKNTQKIPVSLGISGNSGFAEILSGLNEGDSVEF